MRKIALISLLGMTLAVPCSSVAAEVDWTAVDKALGKTAAVQGDVHRYGIPRSDLKVKVDGVRSSQPWPLADGLHLSSEGWHHADG